jgi:hypothetical protein
MSWAAPIKIGMLISTRDWHRRIFTDPRIIECCNRRDIRPIHHDEALAAKN